MSKSNLRQFIRLDFLTSDMWSSIGVNVFMISLLVGLAIVLQNVMISAGALMFLLNSYITNIFQTSEQHNMDALYITLNVKRKTVVKGRYIFAGAILFVGMVLMFSLVGGGLIAERFLQVDVNAAMALPFAVIIAVKQIIIQSIQLPITFKNGMRGSNVFIQIPLLFTLIGMGVLMPWLAERGIIARLAELASSPAPLAALIAAAIALICGIIYISYRISVRVYSKKEF